MRFTLNSLVSSSSPCFLEIPIVIFFSSPHVWWFCFQYSQVFVCFPFFRGFWFFGSSIPSVSCRLPLFIFNMTHFSMPNSIPKSSLYILTAYIRVSNSISFWGNNLMSSMYIRWFIFPWILWNLYLPVYFLSMWLSGIVGIINNNGDNASPRKISHWIFTPDKLFPPAVYSTLQFSTVFSINFMTSLDILYIWIQCIIQLWKTLSYAFLQSIHAIATFFRLVFLSLRMYWSMYRSSSLLLIPLQDPFCSSGNSLWFINEK